MGMKLLSKKVTAFFVVGFLIINFQFLNGCNQENKQTDTTTKAQQDSIVQFHKDSLERLKLEKEHSNKYPKINYNQIIPADRKELNKLIMKSRNLRDTANKTKALITLNRKELRFFSFGQRLVFPDTIVDDIRAYSIFPQYYWGARNLPKLIVVSNKYQAYACYEKGVLVRFAATNTGKETTPTYPGRYSLVWKERNHRSSLDSEWVMPYNFNFHPQAGNAFHQFVMPGRPVSHSCCRQFLDDAEWLFKWGKGADRTEKGRYVPFSGTPVLMLGVFDYARKRGGPWLDLKSNKDSLIQLPEDPMAVEEALIPISQIPVDSRGSLRNISRFRSAEDTLRSKGIIRAGVKLIETKNYNKLRRQKEARALKSNQTQKLTDQKNKLSTSTKPATKSGLDNQPKQNPSYLNEMETKEKKLLKK
jgi:hypothetical protein